MKVAVDWRDAGWRRTLDGVSETEGDVDRQRFSRGRRNVWQKHVRGRTFSQGLFSIGIELPRPTVAQTCKKWRA